MAALHITCSSPPQLVSSVLRSAEPTEVVSLAVTAAQCMRRVRVGLERRQFSQPGASSLTEKVRMAHPCPME